MQVAIIIEVYDECADEEHETGLTEEAYSTLMESYALPGEVVDIKPMEGA